MLPGLTPVFCVLLFGFPSGFVPEFEFRPGFVFDPVPKPDFGPVLRFVFERIPLFMRALPLGIAFPFTTN